MHAHAALEVEFAEALDDGAQIRAAMTERRALGDEREAAAAGSRHLGRAASSRQRRHAPSRPVALAREAGQLGADRPPHRVGVGVAQVRAAEALRDPGEDRPVRPRAVRRRSVLDRPQFLHAALEVRQGAPGLGEGGGRQEGVDRERRQVQVLSDQVVTGRAFGERRLADQVEDGGPPAGLEGREVEPPAPPGRFPAGARAACRPAPRARARRARWRRASAARS